MRGGPVIIISFNVNEVLNPAKRSEILSKLKNEKAQIALFQESHMSQLEHVKLKRMGFKHEFSSSHKRSVATLISNMLTYEHISEIRDDEGRFVSVTRRIEGTEITVKNISPQGVTGYFTDVFLT